MHARRTTRLEAGAGRTLRLAVTGRCNLRCRYCMPAASTSGTGSLRAADRTSTPQLPRESLVRLVAWLINEAGVERVRLTGGEPLLREDVVELVADLAALEGLTGLSATTNGTRLARLAPRLRQAGLGRVNISIDSLDPARYAALTRGGRLAEALAGLQAARAAGLEPIKINSVLMAGTFRHEAPALLDLAARLKLEIRFIELMRTGTEASWAAREHVSAAEVQAWLARTCEILSLDEPAARTAHSSGPARPTRVLWKGHELEVGWITPVSHPFCSDCTRLRLDASGTLRRCLMDPRFLPLAPLAGPAPAPDPETARATLHAYLAGKRAPRSMVSALPMIAVGG